MPNTFFKLDTSVWIKLKDKIGAMIMGEKGK